MQDRIIDFVASHSRVKPDYLREIMMRTDQMANDVGSVIDGREAVACGLIDAVGGIRDALSALRELCGIPEPNRRGG
jgi:ClpP class serine protease